MTATFTVHYWLRVIENARLCTLSHHITSNPRPGPNFSTQILLAGNRGGTRRAAYKVQGHTFTNGPRRHHTQCTGGRFVHVLFAHGQFVQGQFLMHGRLCMGGLCMGGLCIGGLCMGGLCIGGVCMGSLCISGLGTGDLCLVIEGMRGRH